MVGGKDAKEGTVEIFYQGIWGTVCDDDWDIQDASVVCRMIGYDSALTATTKSHFGMGSGIILLDEVKCIGNESNLMQCGHDRTGETNCGPAEAAGVVCNEGILYKLLFSILRAATVFYYI